MAMRPSALSALLLVAAVGCGVPPPPAALTHATGENAQTKPAPPKPTVPENPTSKPPAGQTAAKPDLAKLGLIVTDTKVGTGAEAMPGDTCYMLYAGRLKSNRSEFDSSKKHGNKPFAFQLGAAQVIKGWDLGVEGMKAGGKRTLVIPAALGYGATGQGESIPPNSDLVFDIQLLGILKQADADAVLRDVVKPGTGRAIKQGDKVFIDYVGKLIDGTVFDTTKKPGGKPVSFTVGRTGPGGLRVSGLDAAVRGLRKGAVANVTIPPGLGFGATEQGSVPSNSVLKFEITVVSVG